MFYTNFPEIRLLPPFFSYFFIYFHLFLPPLFLTPFLLPPHFCTPTFFFTIFLPLLFCYHNFFFSTFFLPPLFFKFPLFSPPLFFHPFFCKVRKVGNFLVYRKIFYFWICSNSSDFIAIISTLSIRSENLNSYRLR